MALFDQVGDVLAAFRPGDLQPFDERVLVIDLGGPLVARFVVVVQQEQPIAVTHQPEDLGLSGHHPFGIEGDPGTVQMLLCA